MQVIYAHRLDKADRRHLAIRMLLSTSQVELQFLKLFEKQFCELMRLGGPSANHTVIDLVPDQRWRKRLHLITIHPTARVMSWQKTNILVA
jgi:hypothetical protein